MVFNQIEFYPFIVLVLSALLILGGNQPRKIIILSANLYFYALFSIKFLLLIVAAIFTTYVIGRILHCNKKILNRKVLLFIGLAVNLGVLFYFKYYNFFVDEIIKLLNIDFDSFNYIQIGAPIGVSFFTFRLIDYIIDVYNYRLKSPPLIEFTIYGLFFPIMVCGPISRARKFIPQLKNVDINFHRIYAGYRLFVIGFFLKIFVADRIAPFVNYFYENHEVFNSITAWIAVLGYSIQIYCDFSGYSSMAIGVALAVGIQIEENFNFPYISKSVREFWTRWHITLSEWIRDHLYIVLGGSRSGRIRTFLNLSLAMTLCGLWHGASWTFVIWGFLHGLMLTVNRIWRESRIKSNLSKFHKCYSFGAWIITVFCISISWVPFRSDNLNQSLSIVKKLFLINRTGFAWYHPFLLFIIASFFLFQLLHYLKYEFITLPINNKYTPTILFCLIWLSIVFYPKEFQPFVYANF